MLTFHAPAAVTQLIKTWMDTGGSTTNAKNAMNYQIKSKQSSKSQQNIITKSTKQKSSPFLKKKKEILA